MRLLGCAGASFGQCQAKFESGNTDKFKLLQCVPNTFERVHQRFLHVVARRKSTCCLKLDAFHVLCIRAGSRFLVKT